MGVGDWSSNQHGFGCSTRGEFMMSEDTKGSYDVITC